MAIGPNDRSQRMTPTQAYDASIDAGLRSYMLGVYNYMAAGGDYRLDGLCRFDTTRIDANIVRLRIVLCRDARPARLRAGVELWH